MDNTEVNIEEVNAIKKSLDEPDDIEVITPEVVELKEVKKKKGWQPAVSEEDVEIVEEAIEVAKSYLTDDLFQTFSNLPSKYKFVITGMLTGKSLTIISRELNVSPPAISYYLKRPVVKSIIDYIEITKIREIRNEIVEKSTGGVKIALEELVKLIKDTKDAKIKLQAISTMLEYDSSHNLTSDVQSTALSTNLL